MNSLAFFAICYSASSQHVYVLEHFNSCDNCHIRITHQITLGQEEILENLRKRLISVVVVVVVVVHLFYID